MFENFGYFASVLVQGLWLTVILTVGGAVLALVLSFVAGLANLSRWRTVRVIARIYVEGWRGTSEVVQLFWIYFALPLLIGLQLAPLWAGVLVLGLNLGAYGSEVVRGAILAVPKEQYEGCIALNMTRVQRMRRVILPQAIVGMLPPFNNLWIQLLKASALVSLISVPEITYLGASQLQDRYTGQTLPIFLMILVLYLLLALLITVFMRSMERIANASVGKPPPPTGAAVRRVLTLLRARPGVGGTS